MSSIQDIFKAGNPFIDLVNQLITLESRRKFDLEDQKEVQRGRLTAISTVNSDISKLNSLLTDFANPSASQFSQLAPISSNTDAFTVENRGFLSTSGTFNIEVQQLAKADVRVSAQFNSAGADLISGGSQTFDLTIDGTVSAVTVDTSGASNNAEAFALIATAINDAAGESVQATVLNETTGTARLSVRSRENGSSSAVSFSSDGSATNLAEIAELTVGGADNTNIVGGSANGGRIFNVSELDARFTIDGLQFVRSENVVNDAISGLSIVLRNTTTQNETISITQDVESARTDVDAFISSFNELNREIRSQSFLNAESGDRGPLSNDRIFRDLTFTLRNTFIQNVDLGGGNSISIFDIGLDIEQDGSIVINNEAALLDALENRTNDVQALFSANNQNGSVDATDGLAVRLQSNLDAFVRTGGLIDGLEQSVNERISFIDDRIAAQDEFLERRRSILEQQFLQLQQLSIQADSQFQSIQAIGGNVGFRF